MQEDKNLIIRAQKGDNQAFEELVVKYDRVVLYVANSFRNNPDDAKDIYQEVFLRVHKGLKNFQFKCEFSTWVYRITTNVCISFKRKSINYSFDSQNQYDEKSQNNISFESTIDSGVRTDQSTLDNEIARLINAELDKLPKQQKMAFTLKYYQGFKIKEIAQMMNCTDGTIKRYLFDSTKKMRTKLKPILEK